MKPDPVNSFGPSVGRLKRLDLQSSETARTMNEELVFDLD